MNLAPILLFVYNRAEHTKQTIEALLKNEFAEDSELFIFADGPKPDASESVLQQIAEVRNYIHTIQGFKKIEIFERKTNAGIDVSEREGVSSVLKKYDRCIVFEDDLITHPFCLRFINECLEKYKSDHRISMVGAYNVNMVVPINYRKDVFLMHRCCSYCWGMWRDRWVGADWTLSGVQDMLSNPLERDRFDRGGHDMSRMLEQQLKEGYLTWDISWDYIMYQKDAYVLRPVKSLVYNIGFDGTGVHCGNMDAKSMIAPFPTSRNYNIKLPAIVKVNSRMELYFRNFYDHVSSHRYPVVEYIDRLQVALGLRTRVKNLFRSLIG